MKLSDLNLARVGNAITLCGAILRDWQTGEFYEVMFPDEGTLPEKVHDLWLSLDQWKVLLKQMDLVETEVLTRDTDGKIVKAIVRKCQRNIDQRVSWKVFKRDEYTCRYCGVDGVPMSVDHLVLWEKGGPSIPENLVCACKRCNRTRGNMEYGDWLKSKYYHLATTGKQSGPGIKASAAGKNLKLLDTLSAIPIRYQKRSR